MPKLSVQGREVESLGPTSLLEETLCPRLCLLKRKGMYVVEGEAICWAILCRGEDLFSRAILRCKSSKTASVIFS